MRYPGLGGGSFPRAITALVVAFLATAAALHLLFANANQQPAIELDQIAAGSMQVDSAEEQQNLTASSSDKVLSISKIADRTASEATQTRGVSEELVSLAHELNTLVGQFKL